MLTTDIWKSFASPRILSSTLFLWVLNGIPECFTWNVGEGWSGSPLTKQRIACGKLHSVNRPTDSISSELINLNIFIVRKHPDINLIFRVSYPFFPAGLFLHSLDGQQLSFQYMDFSIDVPGLWTITKLPVYRNLDLSCKDIRNAIWQVAERLLDEISRNSSN
jgi:hypothetical protein